LQILSADFLTAADTASPALAPQLVQALCQADGPAAAGAAASFLRHVAPTAASLSALLLHLQVEL